MIHIVLFQPEIPQNTGNIGRLCAFAQCRLHLIYPLGFELSDKQLRRSGMDYWNSLDIRHYASWQAFEKCPQRPKRLAPCAWGLIAIQCDSSAMDGGEDVYRGRCALFCDSSKGFQDLVPAF